MLKMRCKLRRSKFKEQKISEAKILRKSETISIAITFKMRNPLSDGPIQ